MTNPLHVEIWRALWNNGKKVGEGFGWVSGYNDGAEDRRCYLVSLFEPVGPPTFYFYFPKQGWLLPGDNFIALAYYDGDKSAKLENVQQIVARLSILIGHEAFAVGTADDIPHTQFQRDNPHLLFQEYLSSKGVVVKPPRFLRESEEANRSGYTECSVFVYSQFAGQLFRYEVRCYHERISEVKKFLVATDLGDCWNDM